MAERKKREGTEHPLIIVGIGASAGGLEGLTLFLENVPEKSGLSFVVIQHLDPVHKGYMPELLQRVTKMEVIQVKDRMKVRPDKVYLIPPNKSMSVLHGTLHLLEPTEPRGLRLPIDVFFHSLADDQQEKSIGVILSGMGSDGTQGLKSIKEKGGLVLVQDPLQAKFDGMPRSAIDAGIADIVAGAAELPGRLLNLIRHDRTPETEILITPKVQGTLEKIILLIRSKMGNDFSMYKKNMLYRRIERRMGVNQIDRIQNYLRFLQESPKEVEILYRELLIGVTNFFRDPPVWETLKETVLPALVRERNGHQFLRAWVPGCSTGEEAYSLAMVLKEVIDQVKPVNEMKVQVFATDLDGNAIDAARKGLYPENITSNVSAKRLKRFFLKEEHGYRVNLELREMLVFATQNVIMEPPFTRLDILSCRNLLIYLDQELQKKLISLFHYSLNPGGILILGTAETAGEQARLFTQVDNKSRIYHCGMNKVNPDPVDFPLAPSFVKLESAEKYQPAKNPDNLQSLTEQLLLSQYTPPSVLVNENGDILYINGRTGKYLEPPMGKANWNIFAMVRDELRNELMDAFQQVVHLNTAITLTNLIPEKNGGITTVDVTVQYITGPRSLAGMVLFIFRESPFIGVGKGSVRKSARHGKINTRINELEQELQHYRETLQSQHEEMQTSQEELKSTNEELQSTNEELQSTNEELTTSKEELQSLNEELQTVNAELQSKVDDLSRASSDMKNLLNSTEIATLFLDDDLNIRRFTTQTTKLIKLIPSDTGRPVTDLATELSYPQLADDCREVLRTLAFCEKPITTHDGRWFSVRIMPYRTMDDRIDGLVITFTEITRAKKLEEGLKGSNELMGILFNSTPGAALWISEEGKILEFNPGAEKLFGLNREMVLNGSFTELFIGAKSRKEVASSLKDIITRGISSFLKTEVITHPGNDKMIIDWTIHVRHNDTGQVNGIIAIANTVNRT
jgi:two-component system, chemotaxis family, CheB/CheR fusion protein